MKKTVIFLALAVLVSGVSLAYAQIDTQSSRKAGGPPHSAQMGQRQEKGPFFGKYMSSEKSRQTVRLQQPLDK